MTVVMIKGSQTRVTENRLTRSASRAHLFPFAGCTAVNAVQARSVIADRLGTETGRLFDNSGGAL